jgi:hypothetical protein
MFPQLNTQIIKRLEGTWKGRGRGKYPPKVSEFEYEEVLTIKSTARPSVWEFRSQTTHGVSGKPLHVEMGFIRTPTSGSIELVATHPFGLLEMSSGECTSDRRIELHASLGSLQRVQSATMPFTTGIRRLYELSLNGEKLTFTMDMATSNHPAMQNHLICELEKEKQE